MKCSVAMAVYNGERYIEEQLASILNQTRTVDEVIISDDGSVDDTINIVESFIKKHNLEHWMVYKNNGPHGFIGNFYHAISKTTGDLIFLCDQDDVWIDNRVEKMYNFMKDYSDIAVLNTAVQLVDEEGSNILYKKKKGYCNGNILHENCQEGEIRKFSFQYFVKTNISPGCTMVFRSSIKEQFMEYKKACVEHQFPHDWFINILGSLTEQTCFWNVELTKYRMHNNNTIGLDLSEEEERGIRSTRIQRRKIGEFQYKRALMLKNEMKLNKCQSSYLKKYLAFTKARYEFLENYSFVKLLEVYRYFGMYKSTMKTKSIISDFIYALHMDNLFRR